MRVLLPMATLRRKISVGEIDQNPHAVWNAFVNLLAMSEYAELSPTQRAAHLVFWYESEVQNGGHLQYFENHGIEHLDETIASLVQLGALGQSAVLSRAKLQFLSQARKKIRSVREYVAIALKGEFDSLDEAYYACRPEITEVLQRYLADNEIEFIERIE